MLLNNYNKNSFFKKIEIVTDTLENYLHDHYIPKIDLLKIDTEGHELDVLLGLKKKIFKVNIIIFEHHYDNMIIKNYNFSDINNFLLKHNFKQKFKIKMPFRKSFEYIYKNEKL